MMTDMKKNDPNSLAKYRSMYTYEFKLAKKILGATDYELFWVDVDYQLFVFEYDGVRLVFYPHKTKGTGNTHVRVRSESKPHVKFIAHWLMERLSNREYNCTFSAKTKH